MTTTELNALMAAQKQIMDQFSSKPKSAEFKAASREFHHISIEFVHALIAENGAENIAFVVNHFGGKDSARMLGFIRTTFPQCQTVNVMADIGFEHPEYHVDGTVGGYLRRLSCRVCIFSTKADLRAIYVNDRDEFMAGRTWNSG